MHVYWLLQRGIRSNASVNLNFQDFDRSGMETLYLCHCFGLIILLQLMIR